METKRYKPVHPILRKLINFFWVNTGELPALNHKLLPIKNPDLIINISPQPVSLDDGKTETRLRSIYFTGIMDKFRFVWKRAAGPIELIGVSFLPAGFFPFFEIPLSEFKNSVIDLDLLNPLLAERILEQVTKPKAIGLKIQALEQELLNQLHLNRIIDPKLVQLTQKFIGDDIISIAHFCQSHGIHKRKFERFSNKFLGTNPKTFQKIKRFRQALYTLLHSDYHRITDIAYDSGYYDQMHFIREFKRFTGSPPTQFLVQKKSVQQLRSFK